MSSTTVLKLNFAVVRRYASAAKMLRKKIDGVSPTVEDLIHRELSHRTAAGIVDDFLQSDWPTKKRRVGVRRLQKPR